MRKMDRNEITEERKKKNDIQNLGVFYEEKKGMFGEKEKFSEMKKMPDSLDAAIEKKEYLKQSVNKKFKAENDSSTEGENIEKVTLKNPNDCLIV